MSTDDTSTTAAAGPVERRVRLAPQRQQNTNMTNRQDSFSRDDGTAQTTGWGTYGRWEAFPFANGLQVVLDGVSISDAQVQEGWKCHVCGQQFQLGQRLKAVRENGDAWHWAHEQCPDEQALPGKA